MITAPNSADYYKNQFNKNFFNSIKDSDFESKKDLLSSFIAWSITCMELSLEKGACGSKMRELIIECSSAIFKEVKQEELESALEIKGQIDILKSEFTEISRCDKQIKHYQMLRPLTGLTLLAGVITLFVSSIFIGLSISLFSIALSLHLSKKQKRVIAEEKTKIACLPTQCYKYDPSSEEILSLIENTKIILSNQDTTIQEKLGLGAFWYHILGYNKSLPKLVHSLNIPETIQFVPSSATSIQDLYIQSLAEAIEESKTNESVLPILLVALYIGSQPDETRPLLCLHLDRMIEQGDNINEVDWKANTLKEKMPKTAYFIRQMLTRGINAARSLESTNSFYTRTFSKLTEIYSKWAVR